MGMLTVFFTYIIVAVAMLFLGPFLFRFVTKKFGKFQNNTFKNHAIFWMSWFLLNTAFQYVQSLLFDTLPEVGELMNISLFLTVATHILLCMLIFKAPLISSLKVTFIYYLFFVLFFILVGFLAVLFSFDQLILGEGA